LLKYTCEFDLFGVALSGVASNKRCFMIAVLQFVADILIYCIFYNKCIAIPSPLLFPPSGLEKKTWWAHQGGIFFSFIKQGGIEGFATLKKIPTGGTIGGCGSRQKEFALGVLRQLQEFVSFETRLLLLWCCCLRRNGSLQAPGTTSPLITMNRSCGDALAK